MKNNSKFKKVTSVVSTIIFVVFALTIASVFFQMIKGQEPNIFGYRFYVVVTDSMSPELEVGDVILSKSVNPETIEVGDVVTFVGNTGTQNGLIITHKVIEAPYYDEDNNGYITTQGVRQFSPVDAPVPLENVKAVMVRKMVVLGYLFNLLRRPIGFIILIFIPLMLIAIYYLCKIALSSAKKQVNAELEKTKESTNYIEIQNDILKENKKEVKEKKEDYEIKEKEQ